MARLPEDLMEFAARTAQDRTIRDLIAYRQEGPYGRAGRREPFNLGRRRQLDRAGVPRQGERRGAVALVHGGSTRRSRPWSGCIRSTCSPTCSSHRAVGLPHGALAMIEREGAGVVVALHAGAPDRSTRHQPPLRPAGGYRPPCAPMASARRSWRRFGIHDMILLRTPGHSPVGLRLWAGDRRRALHSGLGEVG